MCTNGNHVVGQIGAKTVRHAYWDSEITAFEAVIDDFNIRGQRDQIDHPGFVTKFSFCTECGAALGGLLLRAPDWKS